jgi:uncharacterized protein YndB with AHSA1/START domain
MPDIFHQFPINAPVEKVFEAISTPNGLDKWWTKASKGKPQVGEMYELFFSPEYTWAAVISKCILNKEFEFTMQASDDDWKHTKVGFTLINKNDGITEAEFYHTGWPHSNEHYKISSYCWAMYLRILKRYLEFGETVSYEERLDV